MMNFTDAQVSKQFDLDAKAFGREAAEFFELILEGEVVCYYAISYLPRLKKYEVVQYTPYVGNLIWTGTTLGHLYGRRTSLAQAKELMMATARDNAESHAFFANKRGANKYDYANSRKAALVTKVGA